MHSSGSVLVSIQFSSVSQSARPSERDSVQTDRDKSMEEQAIRQAKQSKAKTSKLGGVATGTGAGRGGVQL